jgi:type II secretory pathway pseudopilin PulG
LIEVLIVIAIIGILASIVLASLNSARTKAADSNIKAAISSARLQIELSVDAAGRYGNTFTSTMCPTVSSPPDSIFFADSQLRSIIASIASNNRSGFIYCAAGGSTATAASSWAIASPLPSTGVFSTWWCVDSAGRTKLSYSNSPDTFFVSALRYITPTAQAAMGVGPNLGGGASTALCP